MERGLLLFYRQLGMRERLGVRVRQLKGLAAERVHGKAGRRFKPVPHAKLSSDLLHIDRLSLVGAIVGAMTNSQRMREARDRKSTRLNSSHLVISYAVFC